MHSHQTSENTGEKLDLLQWLQATNAACVLGACSVPTNDNAWLWGTGTEPQALLSGVLK